MERVKIKKRYKIIFKFLSLLLFCCLVFNIPVRAKGDLRKSAEEFALTNITQIAKDMPNQGWSGNTKINDAITTYDVDGNINGYIFNLKTKGSESGYMQIFQSGDENYVIAYTFQGKHYFDKMMNAYKNKKKDKKVRDEYKLIYNGNNDFLIEDNTDETSIYYNLTTQQNLKQDKKELKKQYKDIERNIVSNSKLSSDLTVVSNNLLASSSASTTSTTGVTKYVVNANNADLVECSDFTGKIVNGKTVDNHCSPTAGTNLVKYWAKRRGVSKLWYSSDFWVFSSLCVNMETIFSGDNAGTTSNNFLLGLKNYSTYTRGVSYSGYEWWGDGFTESCTFEKAKSYIDANIPFHLDLVGHSEVCFGYNTKNGAKQLIVNTGWDRYWTFQSFSSFEIDYYQYVRWN
ncbi:MAG: hypothetical protein AAGU01_01580 [Clostridiaceae bacterium]